MSSAAPAMRRRAPFYALLIANVISASGNVMSYVAVPWFVLATTGSATKTGITAFFTTLPAVLAALFGSALVDRLGYRLSSVISDIASGVTVVLIPLLYMLGMLEFWHLLVLVFFGALLDAPGNTARESMLPDLAAEAGVSLERASALGDGMSRAALLLGAPVAGALIAWVGPTAVLWIDAATFAVSAALVALFVPSLEHAAAGGEPESYRDKILGGIRFIWRDRTLLAITLTVMITNLLDGALGSVVMPVYAQRVLGSAAAWGLLAAAFGAGAVVGTLLFGAIGQRLPRRPTFIISFVLIGLRFWALAAGLPFPVLIAVHVFCGFVVGPINPLAMTIIYERVPVALRARVLGALSAGALMAIPLAVLLAGYVVEWLGLQTTLLVLGSAYLITTLSMAINPALRDLSAPPATASDINMQEGAPAAG